MKNALPKILVVLLFAAVVTGFFYFDLGQYLSFDYLKESQSLFQEFFAENTVLTIAIYMGIYIATAAFSLPGAAILTLAGGALFGLGLGTLLVSFASTIGATVNFLLARYVLRDSVQSRFAKQLKKINAQVEKDGAFYLFTMRLVPAIPFFVINPVMGLTPMKTLTFFIVSQIGMLPGTAVYVNAGTQLALLDSASGILSANIILSFVLLGIFPLIAKKFLEPLARGFVSVFTAKRVLRSWKKPSHFDYNHIVIGAGSAGLVSAYISAAVKARVLLVERHKMGGDCLNTGCVPSKALIKTAKVMSYAKKANELGLKQIDVQYEFADIMERVQRVVNTVAPHDSVERYTGLGVECMQGSAKIVSPWEVEVDGKRFTTKNIIVATGARPFVPPISGLDSVNYYTSDTIWNLREQPKRLVVLGGGPIGSELSQAFHRIGSQVTQVERGPRIMPREDEEISKAVMDRFKSEGIQILTDHNAVEAKRDGDRQYIVVESSEGRKEIEFDALLLAIGRKANISGFGLEEMGVKIDPRGTIAHNELLQTNIPTIYVCGDVAGPFQFTHTAAHQAWYAAVNSMLAPFWSFKVDYSVIPWSTFTDPEVARVGLNEQEARAQEIPFEVTTFGIDDLDRAIADEEAHGLVKVLTKPGTDKVIGATIMGDHAGDLIVEFVAAMKHGFGLNKILGTIHIYPTLAESNKYAAGNWKKAHVEAWKYRLLERFQSWRRGPGRNPGGELASSN